MRFFVQNDKTRLAFRELCGIIKINLSRSPRFGFALKYGIIKYMGGDNITDNELCILLNSLLALLETDNSPRAILVIKNAIQRIDKNSPDNIEPEGAGNEQDKK